MRNRRPRYTALALAGVLFTAAAGSTGCTLAQKRAALIGAAVGTGVGLVIASEARHDRHDGYDGYDRHPTARGHHQRRSRYCD